MPTTNKFIERTEALFKECLRTLEAHDLSELLRRTPYTDITYKPIMDILGEDVSIKSIFGIKSWIFPDLSITDAIAQIERSGVGIRVSANVI